MTDADSNYRFRSISLFCISLFAGYYTPPFASAADGSGTFPSLGSSFPQKQYAPDRALYAMSVNVPHFCLQAATVRPPGNKPADVGK